MSSQDFGEPEEADVITFDAIDDEWRSKRTTIRICEQIIGMGKSHVAIAMIDSQTMGLGAGLHVMKRTLKPGSQEKQQVLDQVKISAIAQLYADLYNAEMDKIQHKIKFVPAFAYALLGREDVPLVLVEPEIPGHGKLGVMGGQLPELPPKLVDAQISFALFTYRKSESKLLVCRPVTVSEDYWSQPELHSVDGSGGAMDGGAPAMWHFFLEPNLHGGGKVKITPPSLYVPSRKAVSPKAPVLAKKHPNETQAEPKMGSTQRKGLDHGGLISSLQTEIERPDEESVQEPRTIVEVRRLDPAGSQEATNDMPVLLETSQPDPLDEADMEQTSEEDHLRNGHRTSFPFTFSAAVARMLPSRITSAPGMMGSIEQGLTGDDSLQSLRSSQLPKTPDFSSPMEESQLHPDAHSWAAQELLAIRDSGDRDVFIQKVQELSARVSEMLAQEQTGPEYTTSYNSLTHLKPFSRTMMLNSGVRESMSPQQARPMATNYICTVKVEEIENFPEISDINLDSQPWSTGWSQGQEKLNPYSGKYFWKVSFGNQMQETEQVDYHQGDFWTEPVELTVPSNRRQWKSGLVLLALCTTAGQLDQLTGLQTPREIGQVSVALDEVFKSSFKLLPKGGGWYELRNPNGQLVQGTAPDSPPLVYASFSCREAPTHTARV